MKTNLLFLSLLLSTAALASNSKNSKIGGFAAKQLKAMEGLPCPKAFEQQVNTILKIAGEKRNVTVQRDNLVLTSINQLATTSEAIDKKLGYAKQSIEVYNQAIQTEAEADTIISDLNISMSSQCVKESGTTSIQDPSLSCKDGYYKMAESVSLTGMKAFEITATAAQAKEAIANAAANHTSAGDLAKLTGEVTKAEQQLQKIEDALVKTATTYMAECIKADATYALPEGYSSQP